MNVLHLVQGNLTGGAARGALWLHLGLRELGIDSVLVHDGAEVTDYPGAIASGASFLGKLGRAVRGRLDTLATKAYTHRKNRTFSTGWPGKDFRRLAVYRQADILHLHWVNSGFVNMRHLSGIDKPVVWTMRDMWPLTGGCHYAFDCTRYQTGCGQCPQLGSRRTLDLSRWVVWRKKRYLPKSMWIVGISRWLTNCARDSAVLAGFQATTIPNCVDTDTFKPVDKGAARDILGLPRDEKLVLSGAQSPNDFYKGFPSLLQALGHCDTSFRVLFFGNLQTASLAGLPQRWRSFGFLHDNLSLRLLYSAADVFVAPSIVEGFGKTLIEAMSCGTPVVAFNATGPSDIVTHRHTGYLAQAFDVKDLSQGIQWVLSDAPRLRTLGVNARRDAEQRFSGPVVARQYQSLYEKIVLSNPPRSPRQPDPATVGQRK